VRGCGVRLVVLLLLFLGLFDNEGAVAMNKYSIDLEKLNLKSSEDLTFGGLGSTSTIDEEAPDAYPEYDDSLKMALQSARDISFTTVEDGQKSDAQKKFDKTKFLQGIVDASAKPSSTDTLRESLQTTQPTVEDTSTDAQNRAAQEYLGITVDGNWGKGSTRTLASWQYKNGLLVSGELDEETLSAMKNPNTLDPRKESTVRKSVLNETGTAPDAAKVKAWAKENISDPIRAASFVATVEAETGGRALVEGGYRLNRAIEVFVTNNKYMHIDNDLKKPLDGRGLRRKASLEALGTSASGDQIFNYIYGPDADAIGSILGNTTATDGSTYKGRGLIQITGKDNYRRVGKILGIDLVSNPELVNDPKYAAPAAMAYLSLPGKDFFSGTMSRDYLKGVVGHSGGTAEAQTRWNRAQVLKDEMYPGQNN